MDPSPALMLLLFKNFLICTLPSLFSSSEPLPEESLYDISYLWLDEAEVIAFIQNESALKRKTAAWFLDLYDFLGLYFGDTKRSYLWNEHKLEHFDTFCRSKCILTSQNHLVAPKDPEHPDRMVCYSGIASMAELGDLFTDEELVILHPFFQEASVTGRKGASSMRTVKNISTEYGILSRKSNIIASF